MKTTTLKFIKNFAAKDISKWTSKDVYKLGEVEIIYRSSGVYGVNGAIFRDNQNNLYKITKRNTLLFIVL